jgi:hypothetical protein
MKRDATAVIWRTVVFSAAMLGAGCPANKPATTTPPSNTAQAKPTTDNGTSADPKGMAPTKTPAPDDGGNPCGAPPPRPRGTDDNVGGGMGRGFVLS